MVGTIRPVSTVKWVIEEIDQNQELRSAVRDLAEPGEEFRVIDGTDLYGISNRGRVVNVLTKKFLKPGSDRWGHQHVNIRFGEKYKTPSVHRLVAIAFIANPRDYPVVRHMDDVKTNNTVENLCWGTQEDNNSDLDRSRWFRRMAHIEEMNRLGIVTGTMYRRKPWEWKRLIVLDPSLYRQSLLD